MSSNDSINKPFNETSPPKIENLLNPTTSTTTSSSSNTTTTTTTTINDTDRKVKKRTRRKYNDVERYFTCDFANCNKSYGSLTHLNEHRVIQRHGARLKLDDFTIVKRQIEFTKLQRKILNHETIILDPPVDNEYYQSLLLLEQQQQQQFQQQQQKQQQQQMYYSNTMLFHKSIPLLPIPLHHESSITINPVSVATPIPILNTPMSTTISNELSINNNHITTITTNDNKRISNLSNDENCPIDNTGKLKLPSITELLNISNRENDQEVKVDLNR